MTQMSPLCQYCVESTESFFLPCHVIYNVLLPSLFLALQQSSLL